jgi:hypothetical protein
MTDVTHLDKEIGRYKLLLEGQQEGACDWGILAIEFDVNDLFTVKARRNFSKFEWANRRFCDFKQEIEVERFLVGNSELYCEFRYKINGWKTS